MNIRLVLSLIVFVFMSVTSSSSLAKDESNLHDGATLRQALASNVRNDLNNEKFQALEDTANRFRTTDLYFPEGLPKLDAFYNGVTNPWVNTQNGWERHLQIISKWRKKFPNSITARVAEGGSWIQYGWSARGGGFADTVSDVNWRLFEARLRQAYSVLKDAPRSKAYDCPQRYLYLMVIARGLGRDGDEYNRLFKQAIAFNPVYYPYYFEKTTYLLPRWSGEKGDWQRFAEEAVKLTPGSEGMSAYTRILWSAWGNREWSNFGDGVDWKKMRQGFMDIEKNFPDSKWNLNFFAYFATKANDKETARRLFKKIGKNYYIEVWREPEVYELSRKEAME